MQKQNGIKEEGKQGRKEVSNEGGTKSVETKRAEYGCAVHNETVHTNTRGG